MIDPAYVRTLARYNAAQNDNLFGAAAGLDDAARCEPRGAFFGSIHGTLCHLLWADRMWLSRFSDTPKPAVGIKDSPALVQGWADLVTERRTFDTVIAGWAADLSVDWLASDLTWFSGAVGREMRKPAWFLVTHMFNHQSHHRGQVHAMLTAAGARPGDTDLMLVEDWS